MPLKPLNLHLPYSTDFFDNLVSASNQLNLLKALRGKIVRLSYHDSITERDITVSGKMGVSSLLYVEVLEKTWWIFFKSHVVPLTWVRELTRLPQ